MTVMRLALIDTDCRRRGQLCFALSKMAVSATPFESVSEISSNWGSEDAILIHDEPDAVVDAMVSMRDRGLWMPLIAYSRRPTPPQVVRAVQDGASDFLALPFTFQDLKQAIARSENDERGGVSRKRREYHARGLVEQLSRRETQVLSCIASGMPNREIGRSLSISPRTVEIHRSNLMKRMGLQHTAEAIRVAIEAGLNDRDPIRRMFPQ